MKKLLISMLLFFCFYINSFTQDTLVLKNGNELLVKIYEVLPDRVMCKKWDNLDGAIGYSVKKNILMIKYQNGSIDAFTNNEPTNEKESANKQVIRKTSSTNLSTTSLYDPVRIKGDLDEKTQVLYCAKVYGYDISSKDFAKTWLATFDKKYEFYDNNEFELNNKMNTALQEIKSLDNNLKFTDIFTQKMEAEFGKYDFGSEKFEFNPLGTEDKWKAITYRSSFFRSYDHDPSDIWVLNFDDFVGLPMQTSEANILINKRTTQRYNSSYVNRKVYLRIYYSILNKKIQTEGGYYGKLVDEGLYCYAYKIEVWDDECANGNLITIINAKTPAPYYLEKTKTDFEFSYLAGKVELTNHNDIKVGYTQIGNWTKTYENNCERGYFQINCKIERIGLEERIIRFQVHTNYYYVLQNGNEIIFKNYESGGSYSLVINDVNRLVSGQNTISLEFSVKATRSTIQAMINSRINDIEIQVDGSPKYDLPNKVTIYNSDAQVIKSRLNPLGVYYKPDSLESSDFLVNFLKQGL